MCDNSRECAAARAQGFPGAVDRRPLEDAPNTEAEGPVPASVRPGWSGEGLVRLVAVPCEVGEDLDVERSAHFGRSPAFAVARLEGHSIEAWWIVANPVAEASGHGAVAAMLVDEGVTDVITAGIGRGMYQRLAGEGVRVWREQDEATARGALQALIEGRTAPFAARDLHEGHSA